MTKKNFLRRNCFLIYVREKHKPLLIEFKRLINLDQDLEKLKWRRNNFLSISIIQLIYQYVLEKNPNFKLTSKSEENNQENQNASS